MQKYNIAALIIAAGYSSRMHDFKPLLELGGQKALRRLVQTYQEFGVKDIYVVTGYRQEEIRDLLVDTGVTLVFNENFAQGMFSSIQKGVGAFSNQIEAFFMNPADIPLVKKETLERLCEAFGGKGIIYPTFLGKKGHPPLIDIKYKEEILKSLGEGGLKCVLEKFHDDSLHVEVVDQAVLMDMDTKEDYEALCRYESLEVPTKQECLAIMKNDGVDEHIIKHCQAVGEMVLAICKELPMERLDFDEDRLLAAALLHDISRKEKNHAQVGAQKLRLMGYEKIARLIETHMDIDVNAHAPLNENELLFLADKLVGEDKVCGIKKRFEKSFIKFANEPHILENIHKRFRAACEIISKIETLSKKVFLYG